MSTKGKNLGYSIWLEFEDQSRKCLQAKISDLSGKYSCPVFQPHITLVGDIELELNAVRELASTFSDCRNANAVTVCDVGVSESYFMALYLSVSISEELHVKRGLAARRANPSSYKLDSPHISLAYGNLNQNQMLEEQVALKSEYLGKELAINGISIVHSAKSVPIEQWRSIETIFLP